MIWKGMETSKYNGEKVVWTKKLRWKFFSMKSLRVEKKFDGFLFNKASPHNQKFVYILRIHQEKEQKNHQITSARPGGMGTDGFRSSIGAKSSYRNVMRIFLQDIHFLSMD